RDSAPEYFARRVFIIGDEEPSNFLRSVRAFENEGCVFLLEISELGINGIEEFIECLAVRLRVSRDFTKHNCSSVAILVAHEIGAAIAVTFFAPKNVECRFSQPQPACFVL